MRKLLLLGFLAALCLTGPALAAPCQTPPSPVAARIPFPTGAPSDVPFARAMPPSVFAFDAAQARAPAACERLRFTTPAGEFLLTGENGDPAPRRAVPVATGSQPVAYLLSDDGRAGAGPVYMLVILDPNDVVRVRGFYTGVPDDAVLVEAITHALAETSAVINIDLQRSMVMYGFTPPGGAPPPVQSATLADGSSVTAGPQVMLFGAPGVLMEPAAGKRGGSRHRPSGFVCPHTIDDTQVLLMSIEPAADGVRCNFRVGTDLRYNPDDEIRYQLTVARDPGADVDAIIRDFVAEAPRGSRERTSPLPAAQMPTPGRTAFVNLDGRTLGAWFARRGEWLIVLQASYPEGAANDTEAERLARVIYAGESSGGER